MMWDTLTIESRTKVSKVSVNFGLDLSVHMRTEFAEAELCSVERFFLETVRLED